MLDHEREYSLREFLPDTLKSGPQPSVIFSVFDRKFLESKKLYAKAIECGIPFGMLMPANGRTQLSLQQVNIKDDVHDFDYHGDCDRPEFREYITYSTELIQYNSAIDNPGTNCGVDGTTPPSEYTNAPACEGDLDMKFVSNLVTTQRSDYSKNWVDILTEEVSRPPHWASPRQC